MLSGINSKMAENLVRLEVVLGPEFMSKDFFDCLKERIQKAHLDNRKVECIQFILPKEIYGIEVITPE
jgi:hypothetical protein